MTVKASQICSTALAAVFSAESLVFPYIIDSRDRLWRLFSGGRRETGDLFGGGSFGFAGGDGPRPELPFRGREWARAEVRSSRLRRLAIRAPATSASTTKRPNTSRCKPPCPDGLYELWVGYNSPFGFKGYDYSVDGVTGSGGFDGTASNGWSTDRAGTFSLTRRYQHAADQPRLGLLRRRLLRAPPVHAADAIAGVDAARRSAGRPPGRRC